MRPEPKSPQANSPAPGSATNTPRSRSRLTLCCVAGCSHMLVFMAGAMTTVLPKARIMEVSRLSATPLAIFARVFAVAGAITMMSASWASSTWVIFESTRNSLTWSRRTGACDRVSKVMGPTNWMAARVMMTRTSMPAFCNRRSSSAAL